MGGSSVGVKMGEKEEVEFRRMNREWHGGVIKAGGEKSLLAS